MSENAGTAPAATDRGVFIPGGRTGVLLVHGLGGTPTELRYVAQALARSGHTVYCCQLAGHCGTPEELRLSTWRDWYASVEAAHDKLKQHCDVVFAGGLSMGAILALHLGYNRPNSVHGLLLFAPALRLDGWAMPWHSRLLRFVRPTPIPLEFDMPEHEPYGIKDERMRAIVVSGMQSGNTAEAGIFSTPLRSLANMNALCSMVRRNLGKIKQPAFIAHPRNDDMASFNNAVYVQKHLGGLVDCVVLDNSYHIVTLDQQREVVAERSIDFVARVERGVQARGGVRPVVPAGRGKDLRTDKA
jgi:carboxylesterase